MSEIEPVTLSTLRNTRKGNCSGVASVPLKIRPRTAPRRALPPHTPNTPAAEGEDTLEESCHCFSRLLTYFTPSCIFSSANPQPIMILPLNSILKYFKTRSVCLNTSMLRLAHRQGLLNIDVAVLNVTAQRYPPASTRDLNMTLDAQVINSLLYSAGVVLWGRRGAREEKEQLGGGVQGRFAARPWETRAAREG